MSRDGVHKCPGLLHRKSYGLAEYQGLMGTNKKTGDRLRSWKQFGIAGEGLIMVLISGESLDSKESLGMR